MSIMTNETQRLAAAVLGYIWKENQEAPHIHEYRTMQLCTGCGLLHHQSETPQPEPATACPYCQSGATQVQVTLSWQRQ
jgi:Zn finger protein HypA/HybF involved in hydrogenase expression